MSGRTKRIIYYIFYVLFCLCALLSVIWMAAHAAGAVRLSDIREIDFSYPYYLYFIGGIVLVLLGVPTLLHEFGHLVFGAFCGMRPYFFRVGWLTVLRGKVGFSASDVAGEVQAYPVRRGKMRARVLLFTLGGSLMELILGGALFAVGLAIRHPAVLLAGAAGAFSIAQGLSQLLPVTWAQGRTDGGVILGIIKNAPEEEVMLRVYEAQGILYRGSFGEIPRELLFCCPVVREDAPAFQALTLLRAQYSFFHGDEAGAKSQLDRLAACGNELIGSAQDTLKRYEAYFSGGFVPDPNERLGGVRTLEETLAAK